jgi:hypothetical protein
MGDTVAITYLLTMMRNLADRLDARPDETSGHGRRWNDIGAMTTETVVIIAGVTAKANSIPTG